MFCLRTKSYLRGRKKLSSCIGLILVAVTKWQAMVICVVIPGWQVAFLRVTNQEPRLLLSSDSALALEPWHLLYLVVERKKIRYN